MNMLTVSKVIAAPAPQAWRILIDPHAWPEWGPSITGADFDGTESELTAQTSGHVRTAVGVRVPFVVTDFDPGTYWAWKVAGIPATSHRVDPVDGGARVSMGVPWWAPAYLVVCAIALHRIENLLVP